MTLSIGIDVGGTKIAAGRVDEDGVIVARARRSTPAQSPDEIAAAIVDLIEELSSPDVCAVGVACAGYIDKAGATVLFSPNLAWRDEPLKERICRHTTLPVVIENDANAAAYGEFVHGAGRSLQDMVMITVGTGVGGGVVNDGRLLRGAFGIGGEIGHMVVVPGGRLCGCGNRGCLEAYGSGTALTREARELVRSGAQFSARLSHLCHGDADRLTGAMVTGAAVEGDTASIDLLAQIGNYVGEAAASMAALLDPEGFVIGGGVADAGELLIEPMRAAFGRSLTGRGYRPIAQFVQAELGNDAGVIGAAVLALNAVDQ